MTEYGPCADHAVLGDMEGGQDGGPMRSNFTCRCFEVGPIQEGGREYVRLGGIFTCRCWNLRCARWSRSNGLALSRIPRSYACEQCREDGENKPRRCGRALSRSGAVRQTRQCSSGEAAAAEVRRAFGLRSYQGPSRVFFKGEAPHLTKEVFVRGTCPKPWPRRGSMARPTFFGVLFSGRGTHLVGGAVLALDFQD